MIVFVYGSLLRGEENHAVMAHARFVAEARTVARYTLVDRGQYPALVAGGETAVLGELYEVDEALLEVLDEFEGHPHLYLRSPVDLEGDHAAHAYLLSAKQASEFPIIRSGDWRSAQGRKTA